jgi:hypothetical protein
MMIDGQGDYESLVAVAVQAALTSPAVVNTPANVAPSAPEVEKAAITAIKAVAPDDSDDRLRQIARQATQAVVTNPAVIATPAGQTVNTTTIQGIIAASAQPVPGAKVATAPVASVTSPEKLIPTSVPVVDEQTQAAAKRAQAPKPFVGASPVETALGRDIGSSTATKETPLERLARIAAERERTQSGENPDNPMPTEDPGPGMYWANFGGTWRKYKYVTDSPGSVVAQDGPGAVTEDGAGADVNAGGKNAPVTKSYTASDGKEFTDQQAFVDYEISLRDSTAQKNLIADQNKAERKSAYDLLFSEFKQYGLDALVTPLKSLIEEGISPSEFTIRLRETDAYKKRFAANAQRVAKGLRSLSEAEYIGTEDQYQDVMRRYGMPESYYTKGELGIQSGFEKFLAGDVSAVELEDRIQTAQNRVLKSNPEVAKALKEFYPGISNGDILSYVLDPANAIENIKRKVTAAEIGGAAIQSGLQTGMTRAEELAAAGITKQQAQQGFQTVAEVAPRGGQLAAIYGETPYTQQTAEQEVFGLAGSTEAAKQRKKLTSLETAAFSGSAGSGAIARERAGAF